LSRGARPQLQIIAAKREIAHRRNSPSTIPRRYDYDRQRRGSNGGHTVGGHDAIAGADPFARRHRALFAGALSGSTDRLHSALNTMPQIGDQRPCSAKTGSDPTNSCAGMRAPLGSVARPVSMIQAPVWFGRAMAAAKVSICTPAPFWFVPSAPYVGESAEKDIRRFS
jgi:hypothetical protein